MSLTTLSTYLLTTDSFFSVYVAWVDGCPNGQRPVELVQRSGLISKASWEMSQAVLKALHSELVMKYCRTWLIWNSQIPSLIQRTAQYSANSVEEVSSLVSKWGALIHKSKSTWEKTVHCCSIVSQPLDELELIEQALLLGDGQVEENDWNL